MRQKYLIIKNKKDRKFVIREFAELDKDKFSLLCEESYDTKTIRSAAAAGQKELVAALRTNNFYPPGTYVEKIAAALLELQAARGKESVELFFDDITLLTGQRGGAPAEVAAAEPIEEQPEDLEEIIAENFEDNFDDEKIKRMDSSLKIDDDDYVDLDDE